MTMTGLPSGGVSESSGTVRHGRLKSSHPVAAVFKFLGVALIVIVVSAASVGGIAVWQLASSGKAAVSLVDKNGKKVAAPPDVGAIEGGVNLLLAGTDTRSNQGGQFANKADQAASSGAGNNDVTMLLHISQDHKSVTVVSFPRDLMVPIPACPRAGGGTIGGTSSAMFNTSLSRGGLSCVVLTVEKMTGLTIPYAAEISFDGVIAMSNAIGGVDVCLATPLKDPYVQLDLPAGKQTIQGAQALAFVRSRHGVGDGSDLGRISNQQVFLSSLARKVTTGGVLQNPVQLFSLAKAAVSNMTLSDTLQSPTTLVTIGLALKTVGVANMVLLQYPVASDPADPNRVVAISSSAAILNAALVADKPVVLSGAVGRAAVLDPTAPVAPAAPAPAPSGKSTVAPSTTPTPASTAVVLPSTITGQNASQQTCSAKEK
jgi:LCP family protein required for cell wall assembly